MSTQFYTQDQPATTPWDPRRDPRPHRGGPSWYRIAAVAYEGPVDGIMGPQTIAAIKDLQRQAGLPQTGTMTPATQTALANYLAHGNNQMAG
jgi:peptidoglycan hydrolase-like protein with peptidoglycan-binding domain